MKPRFPDEQVVRTATPRSKIIASLLVGALVLVLIVRGWRDGRDATAAGVASTTATDPGLEEAIASFARYTAQESATEHADLVGSYGAKGVRELAEVIERLSARVDAVLANDALELRTLADKLEANAASTDQTAILRDAFAITSAALGDIQRVRFESLASALAELRKKGEQLNPERPLLSQMQLVQTYFAQASDVLLAMSEMGL